jgi:Protein of unknown function (DUF1402)
MTTKKPSDSSHRQPNDNQLAGWPWGRESPYTGRAPYQSSPDPDAEKKREEVITLIQKHADDINQAALRYNVPPETIAGAILWEAIENYRHPALDSGGPGRIHNETAFTLWREGKVPSGYVPVLDTRKPEIAIVYIAAIMNESAENYELIAGVNIRKNIGALNTLYQTGDSKRKAELLRDGRKIDIANKRPPRQPIVPSKAMGEYVENHRLFIRNQLLGLPLEKEGAGKTTSNSLTTKLSYQLAASKVQAKASKFLPLGLDVRNERDLHVAIAITSKIGGWDSEKILQESPYSQSLSPEKREAWLEGITSKANDLLPSKMVESNMQNQTSKPQIER